MSAILKKPHSFAQLKVSNMSFPANDGMTYTPFANRTWMFKREYRQKWRTVMSCSMFYLWFKLIHWEMQTRSLQHSFFGWNLRSICEPLQLFPFFLRLLFHSSPSLSPSPLLLCSNHLMILADLGTICWSWGLSPSQALTSTSILCKS